MKETLIKILNKAFPKDPFFDKILAITLSFESEYTKKDEPTYRGITERTYKAYAEQHGLTIKDIRQLTDDEIWEIYYNEFYLKPKIFTLPKEIQGLVFDFIVNSNPIVVVKELQKTIGAKANGYIGNETRDKTASYLRNFGVNSFIANYHKRRKGIIQEAIGKDPRKKQFWQGWLNRLERLREVYRQ